MQSLNFARGKKSRLKKSFINSEKIHPVYFLSAYTMGLKYSLSIFFKKTHTFLSITMSQIFYNLSKILKINSEIVRFKFDFRRTFTPLWRTRPLPLLSDSYAILEIIIYTLWWLQRTVFEIHLTPFSKYLLWFLIKKRVFSFR